MSTPPPPKKPRNKHENLQIAPGHIYIYIYILFFSFASLPLRTPRGVLFPSVCACPTRRSCVFTVRTRALVAVLAVGAFGAKCCCYRWYRCRLTTPSSRPHNMLRERYRTTTRLLVQNANVSLSSAGRFGRVILSAAGLSSAKRAFTSGPLRPGGFFHFLKKIAPSTW